MNQYKKLKNDTALFAISNFSSKLLVFFLLPLYTSCLSSEEYGIVDLLNNIVNVLFPILTFSIIEGVLRFSFDKECKKEDVLTISVYSIGVSTFILILATPVSFFLGGVVKEYWMFVVLIYFGYTLSTTISYYLRGINKVRLVALQGVCQTAITVCCNMVFLVLLKKGILGYIYSISIGYIATTIIILIKGKIYADFKSFYINRCLLKEMLHYCIPMIPSKIAWWINNSADKYFIIVYIGIGASGLYSIAHKIPTVLSVLSEIFNQAWQLSAIEVYENKDAERNDFYSQIQLYYFSFLALSGSVLIIMAQLVGKILFANEYYQAWIFIPPLIVAAIFSSLSGFYHSIFRAAKMSKQLGLTVLIGTGANLILNFLLIPRIGGLGAAYATMLGFVFEWIFSYYYTKQLIMLSMNLKKVFIITILLLLECISMSSQITIRYSVSAICILLIIVFSINCIRDIFKKLKNRFRKNL